MTEPIHRLLVTGSRDWDDRGLLLRTLHLEVERTWPLGRDGDGEVVDYVPPRDFVLVHGGARGADSMAEDWAVGWFVNWEVHKAEWDKYGKAAGFRRNARMVDLGADLCIAFIKNRSRGATMTADLAEKAGIKTIRVLA